MVDGMKVMFTAEEETARDAEEAAWAGGADDRKKNGLRVLRIPLLEEADHAIFKLEDAGSDTSDWKTYRQALRDITAGDLDNPSWPSKP